MQAPPKAEPDDAALVEGLREGDNQAFETIVRRYGGRLLAVTRRMLGNDDAPEAVQQTFIQAFRARKQFHGESRLSTWLHRIAVNVALTKLRSRRRRPEESIDELLPTFNPAGHHAQRFASWVEPADVAFSRKETSERVRQAIDQLPESYRTVLLLRDIEELTTEETATMLHITANAVKIRLHRARMALRALIAPELRGAA